MTAYEQLETIGSKLDKADAVLRREVKHIAAMGDTATALVLLSVVDRICEAKRALGWPAEEAEKPQGRAA